MSTANVVGHEKMEFLVPHTCMMYVSILTIVFDTRIERVYVNIGVMHSTFMRFYLIYQRKLILKITSHVRMQIYKH